ncbi:MAG: cytochrome d ubiquinol oxidase subunit II [Bacteroidales bacterium]
MFEKLSLLQLQQYWWIIVSLLGATLVFLMFIQGGQMLIYKTGKTDAERTLIINALGRKWELTFTTLVTFGGAFFASFPLFYSTSFGGAYWVWMAILFAFIIQAVSYEFRTKAGNFLGAKTYEKFLFINGAAGTFLLGVAVSTFFTGSEFSVNKLNLLNLAENSTPIISKWESPFHGLEALWTLENFAFLQNISLGLAVFFLSRLSGLMFFIRYIDHPSITEAARRKIKPEAVLFLIFFLLFAAFLLFSDGFAIKDGIIVKENFKILHNLIEMPLVLLFFITGVALVLISIYKTFHKFSKSGFFLISAGTFLVVLSLFALAGLNNTAFYPSTYDLQSSLTIQNSSSSHYTLTIMSYVSLLVPIVAGYIWYVWKAMSRQKISMEEIEKQTHIY